MMESRRSSKKEYEEIKSYKFRARPLPNSTFGASVGVPKKKTRKVTQAKTPMVLKRKVVSGSGVSKAKNKGPNNNAMKRLKALPLSDLKKVFEKADIKVTKVRPFSFDSRYSKPNEVKEKLLEKENLELQKKREFKARYPYVVYEEPFVPKKDSRSRNCKVEEFKLHSKKRGEERKKYDIERKLLRDKEEAEQALEREKAEKKEIAELRKKMVHRANNIGKYNKQEYQDIS